MDNSRALFLCIRLFNTVESKQIIVQYKSLPMTGFELDSHLFSVKMYSSWQRPNINNKKRPGADPIKILFEVRFVLLSYGIVAESNSSNNCPMIKKTKL